MGEMADYFNEIHELECSEYEDLRYSSNPERYEAGHIDEYGNELYESPVLFNPELGMGFSGKNTNKVEFAKDSMYYHIKINDLRLINSTRKSYLIDVHSIVNKSGEIIKSKNTPRVWVPKKICRQQKFDEQGYGSMYVYSVIFVKIIDKWKEKNNESKN